MAKTKKAATRSRGKVAEKGRAGAAKKATAKKTTAKKTTSKRAASKKAVPKKAAPKKAAPKKTASNRAVVKKVSAKPAAKKASARRPARRTSRKATGHGGRKPSGLAKVLEAKLSEQRDEILNLYRRDLGLGVEVNHEGDDEIDRANFDSNRDLALALSKGERETLLQIEEALTRIEHDIYGECVFCTKPVGDERLRVIPWARHCVSCQELEEKGLLE